MLWMQKPYCIVTRYCC